MADYDVVSGLSGTLRYLLLSPSANSDLIALVLEELVSVAHVKRGRPGWTVMHPPSVVSDPADFPFGHVNVGLAHGAAGILAAISLATSAGVLVPGQEEAIETLSNWLLAVQLTEPGGLNWPPFLGHRDATVTGTRAHNGWCYGIPGIARSLQLAGKAMENSNWTNAADAAMKSMVDRSTADYVVGEPGLCHGWAGTMHATWRFATNSTDGAMDHWVDTAAASVIASYEPGSQFGFRSAIYSPSDSPVWTDDGGFITGAAGIALALHRYSRDAIPATLWDSALLVV
jgi:lantibiotic modifying enzyme